MMHYFDYFLFVFVFILGAIIGSYLNVYILRLNTGKNTKGRSACMSCGAKLRWYDLVPIFSFVFLKGRCRSCKSKISLQYPIVEFLNALLYLILFLLSRNMAEFVLSSLLLSLTLVISVYDIRHRMIPASTLKYLYLLAILLFLYRAYYTYNILNIEYYTNHLLSLLLFAGPVFLIWFLSKGQAMGFGDVKIIIPLSILLWPQFAFFASVLSFSLGATVGLLFVVFSKFTHLNYNLKSQIAFAPFIIIAFWFAFFAQLSQFYIFI